MIIAFFRLIRFKNLIILALSQIVFKYMFLNMADAGIGLSNLLFFILLTSTLFLAAAGYIINDIYDEPSDKINKPQKVIINHIISEKTAIKIYIAFNSIGLGLGYYLSYKINHSGYALLFLFVAFSLLKYAQSWKKIIFVKNILIAFLISLSILILGIYDILPSINYSNFSQKYNLFLILLNYALIAFLINLIREIIKDIEDVKGDAERKINSIIRVFGLKKTKFILYSLNLLLLLTIGYYTLNYFSHNTVALFYIICLVILPSIINFALIIKAKEKINYQIISKLLKLIMLFGLGSIAMINLINKI